MNYMRYAMKVNYIHECAVNEKWNEMEVNDPRVET